MNDETRQKAWDQAFDHLRAFNAEFGHCNVPSAYQLQDGFKLGRWLTLQRMEFKTGGYLEHRQAKMEAIGVVWSIHDQAWEAGFAQLKQFVQINGHSRLHARHLSQDGYPLGEWIARQRADSKSGRLSPVKTERLNALGFDWSIHSTEWEDGISRLASYFQVNGHGRVPPGYMTEDGFALGIWVKQKRGRIGTKKISQVRIDQLETLGVVPGTHRVPWVKGIELLVEFIRLNGHADVPKEHISKGEYALGVWLWNHKRLSRNANYPQRKRSALEGLGVTLGSAALVPETSLHWP